MPLAYFGIMWLLGRRAGARYPSDMHGSPKAVRPNSPAS